MSYTSCAAPSCQSRPGSGLLFKTFPFKHPAVAADWLKQFPAEFQPRPSTAVCEKHFQPDQFEKIREDGRKKLKASAVPLFQTFPQPVRTAFRDVTNSNVNGYSPKKNAGQCLLLLGRKSTKTERHDIPLYMDDSSKNLNKTEEITPLHNNVDILSENIWHSTPKTSASRSGKPGSDSNRCDQFLILNESPVCQSLDPLASDLQNIFNPEEDSEVFVPVTNSPKSQYRTPYEELLAQYEQHEQEIEELKEKLDAKDVIIKELEAQFASPPFRRKYRAVAKAKHRLQQSSRRNLFFSSPWLTQNQVKALSRKTKRGVKWGAEEYRQGLIHKCKSGTRGYNAFVQQYPILPSVRSLQEYVQFIKFTDSGLLEDIFNMMGGVVPTMSEKELDCLIVLDEVEIQQGKCYDVSLGRWVGNSTLPGHEGNARKALLFLLAGVSKRWKISVAVYFTSKKSTEACMGKNSTGEEYKKILDAVISRAISIGLKPCGIVSDMGPDNLAMWKAYNITGSRTEESVSFSFSCPTPSGLPLQVRVKPDPIHLFKAIKAAMESNKVIHLPQEIVELEGLPSNVVDYRHIDDLYELESNNELKLAFRLKPWNLHVGKHFKKMNVNTSRAVVCHRTGVGQQMMAEEKQNPDYLTTSWFIMLLNLFFELVTCRHKGMAVSKHNIKTFDKSLALIKMVERVFRFMKIGLDGGYKPCQRGMRILCASLLDLIYYFLDQRLYAYLMLGRFNSDCIENMFSLIRFRQKVPTALAFLQILKVITLAQFSEAIKGCNYDYEESSPLSIQDFIEEAKKRAKERSCTKFYASLEELFLNPIKLLTFEDLKNLNEWEQSVIYDMAGSVMAALKKSSKTFCDLCIEAARWQSDTPHPRSVITDMKEFTYFKSEENSIKLQFYVSDVVFKAVLYAEITFRMYRAKTMNFQDTHVLNYFVDSLMYVWNAAPLPNCHGLGRKILEYYLTGRLKEYGRVSREEVRQSVAGKRTMECMSSKSAAGFEAASKLG